MATFKRQLSQNVGTSLTKVGNYTVGAGVTTTIIGLVMSNVTGNTISVSATLDNGTVNTYIVKDATLVAGGSLIAVGGDRKIVLQTNDSIRVSSSAASSVDAILSVLEV